MKDEQREYGIQPQVAEIRTVCQLLHSSPVTAKFQCKDCGFAVCGIHSNHNCNCFIPMRERIGNAT